MSAPRLALVTGGAVRLGEAISRKLAAAGYFVIVHANRHAEQATKLARELRGAALTADLADRGAIRDLFRDVDRLDGNLEVLVNNAGLYEELDPAAVAEEAWDRHLAVNLTAPFLCSQQAERRMRRNGRGSIVNLLDICALRPYRRTAHYAAAKAGLWSLTVGLAAEWAPAIRVNGVAPGDALLPETFDRIDRSRRLARVPQQVEMGADAVAETVRFLVDGPHGITGEIIRVDGGRTAAW